MTDDQLERHLQSVGKAAFVTHLSLFQGNRSTDGAAAELEALTGWRPLACLTRVSNARAILAAGRLADALDHIAEARVPAEIRQSARMKRALL